MNATCENSGHLFAGQRNCIMCGAENKTPQPPQTCGDKLDAEKQELWNTLDAIAHWKVTHQSYQIVVSDIRNYAADKIHELKKKYWPDEAPYDWQGRDEL